MTVRLAAAACVALAVVAGCRDGKPKSDVQSTAPSAVASSAVTADAGGRDYRVPRLDNELPTTSASIYFSNLDGQIERAKRRKDNEPTSAAAHRDLASIVYGRAKHHGDLAGLSQALALVTKAIELDPTDAASYVVRANQLQTVHRFPEARKDLEAARARGAADTDVEPIETELDYAQGLYDKAIPRIRKAATFKTSSSVARLALLEHDLGNIELADKLFSEAEGLVRDPNPIPVAWLNLQRGVHCQTTGQPERAVTFFQEAVRRIPGYIAAEEHLAETLHGMGKDAEAAKLYESIVARSTDPEFKGALAGVYRALGRTAEADGLVKQATADYQKLLEAYPQAMYWHASEFFMGEGKNPKLAVELLTKNIVLRPGFPSFVAMARAQLQVGNVPAAELSIRKAQSMPLVSAEGFWTAAKIEDARKTADSAARAEALRVKARALDPHIGAEH